MSRHSAHEQMQAELVSARPCHHCGERRSAHYAGVVAGCRQGRSVYLANMALYTTQFPQLNNSLYIGPIGPTVN